MFTVKENIQNFVGFLYQLFDSAHYFLSDVERLCCPEYEPSDQDVLRTRVATTGIVKVEFEYRHLTFNLLDVGGQVWPLVPTKSFSYVIIWIGKPLICLQGGR